MNNYEVVPLSGIKKFITGKRPAKSTETIAALRKRTNKLQIRARALKRMSEEERENAKQFLREGNKNAAQQSLLRRKKYQNDLSDIYKKAALLQNVMQGINNAQDTVEMVKELEQAQNVMETLNKQANPERTEDVMLNLETNMEQLDMVSERLTDSSLVESDLDSDYDPNEIENVLTALMREIEQETGAPITSPRVPVRTSATTSTSNTSTRASSAKVSSSADLEDEMDLPAPKSGKPEELDPREKEIRDEIARIKKEMESELK